MSSNLVLASDSQSENSHVHLVTSLLLTDRQKSEATLSDDWASDESYNKSYDIL